jgi:hypothetical protein
LILHDRNLKLAASSELVSDSTASWQRRLNLDFILEEAV